MSNNNLLSGLDALKSQLNLTNTRTDWKDYEPAGNIEPVYDESGEPRLWEFDAENGNDGNRSFLVRQLWVNKKSATNSFTRRIGGMSTWHYALISFPKSGDVDSQMSQIKQLTPEMNMNLVEVRDNIPILTAEQMYYVGSQEVSPEDKEQFLENLAKKQILQNPKTNLLSLQGKSPVYRDIVLSNSATNIDRTSADKPIYITPSMKELYEKSLAEAEATKAETTTTEN